MPTRPTSESRDPQGRSSQGATRIDRLHGWLRIGDPPWLQLGRKGTAIFIVAGCVLIIAWHSAFVREADLLKPGIHSAKPGYAGLYVTSIQTVFYFFYYTGQYPIGWFGSRRPLLEDPELASSLIEPGAANQELVNELHAVIGKGDFGQIFLLFPHAWKYGVTLKATPKVFNQYLALSTYLALFLALSLTGHKLLALVFVPLIGSQPFAVDHLYRLDNIWAYPIAMGSLMLALCAPLVFSLRPRRWHALIPLAAGVMLASVREVRAEPWMLIISVAIACAFARGGWLRRAALVAVLLVSFGFTTALWSHFWEARFEQSYRTVEEAGGRPFNGSYNQHHALWHPIWCGLADFARDKGYRWLDTAAYRYAIPIINQRHGTDHRLLNEGAFVLESTVPGNPGYQMKPELLPEYTVVIREKVLGDIADDPLWYLGVLSKRAERIMDRAPEVRLHWGATFTRIPFSAWWIVPVLALAVTARRWDATKVLLFYTPTSLAAFLIYSDGGMTNPTSFHVATLAVMVCWVVNGVSIIVVEKLRRVSARESDDSSPAPSRSRVEP